MIPRFSGHSKGESTYGAPSTIYQAYRKAQEAVKEYGDIIFPDEEIDALLPEALTKC